MILDCKKQLKGVGIKISKKKQNLANKRLISKDIKALMRLTNKRKVLKVPRDAKLIKKNLLECIQGLSL